MIANFTAVSLRRRAAAILFAAALLTFASCAVAPVQLPPNVSVVQGGQYNASYIDKVDFTYKSAQSPDFGKLKLCIAESVTNDAVQLRDSSGSFVGAATRHYYQVGNTQSVGGGSVFKYIDDSKSTLIANGVTVAGAGNLTQDYVRFELKSAVTPNEVQIQFYSVTRAQANTGAASNDGFAPVGIWQGSRSPEVYSSLEAVAAKVKGCLQG